MQDTIPRLFDEHHAALFRFAYRMTGSISDAEDIVQECFLALLQPGCSYDARRTAPRTYLFGAVRNQALKRLRLRERTAGPPEDGAGGGSPESDTLRAELEQAVARAVMQLPETQRTVLVLVHYERMSLAEAAQVMDIDIGAVKSRLQRARATLKQKLAAFAPSREEKA